MARLNDQYAVLETPAAQTSTGVADVKTFTPSSKKRATAVMISVETTDARVTFDGTAPAGVTGPGIVIPKGQPPLIVPLPADADNPVKVAANSAASSLVSVVFLV
jgi:hypothetical protein